MTAKWQYKQAYEGVLGEVRSLKAENADLRKRITELEYERMMMFLELVGEWIKVKQREMEAE